MIVVVMCGNQARHLISALPQSMMPGIGTYLDALFLHLLRHLLVIPWVYYGRFFGLVVDNQIHPVVGLSDLIWNDFHIGAAGQRHELPQEEVAHRAVLENWREVLSRRVTVLSIGIVHKEVSITSSSVEYLHL